MKTAALLESARACLSSIQNDEARYEVMHAAVMNLIEFGHAIADLDDGKPESIGVNEGVTRVLGRLNALSEAFADLALTCADEHTRGRPFEPRHDAKPAVSPVELVAVAKTILGVR